MDLRINVNTDSKISEISPASSPEPTSPEIENRTLNDERIHSPNMTVTNFSIANILKPDFGVKKFKTNLFHNTYKSYNRPSVISSDCLTKETTLGSKIRNSNTDSREKEVSEKKQLWPAWVYCTRYSDRPTSGPRARHVRRKRNSSSETPEDKRPRVAFTNDQLEKLRVEFEECRYLTEARRKDLAIRLNLSESQIKIWFQNKRAKLKKSSGYENPLAQCLRNQGLYNHTPLFD